MRGDLDDLLSGLASAPADRSLHGLEGAVMDGVARGRADRRTLHVLLPAQAAAVAVSVAIGVFAGGAAGRVGPAHQEFALVGTELAPSTLLTAEP
jgi:hypothetical protein